MVRTGRTFRDAAEEWLDYCEKVRDCKASTLRDYRNMVRVLDREFGDRKIEAITPEEIELWISGYDGSNRTRQKYLVCLGSIFKRAMKVHGLPRNPAEVVERPRVRRAAKIDVLRPEEVLALVRAAKSEQDAAIFHTAAFAGLRMGELLALRWRDIDFTRRTIHVRENWTQGETTTPKGGTERAVPMAEEVAQRLARLGQRDHFTTDDNLVFCTPRGEHLGYKSLKERYRGRAQDGRPARGLPLPQPPPHLRQHRDPPCRLARGHGVDGSRRPHHDAPLSRLRRPRGCRQAGFRGIQPREAAAGPDYGWLSCARSLTAPRAVGVLRNPGLQVAAREPQPTVTYPNMRQPSHSDQLVERAARHPEQPGRLAGVEQWFGEQAGFSHRPAVPRSRSLPSAEGIAVRSECEPTATSSVEPASP